MQEENCGHACAHLVLVLACACAHLSPSPPSPPDTPILMHLHQTLQRKKMKSDEVTPVNFFCTQCCSKFKEIQAECISKCVFFSFPTVR